jgi:hypothetical protein
MPRYLLKTNGKTSGPHSLAALEQMSSVRAFDESALLTPEGAEEWKPVRDLPELQAVLFPPRKAIPFKEKSFETVAQENNEPISVDKILHANLVAEAKNAPPFNPVVRFPNRRRRDFLTAVILCDLLAAGVAWYLPHSQIVSVSVLSFVAITNLGLYWLFYQIMDRY